jgi:hypothetical protein
MRAFLVPLTAAALAAPFAVHGQATGASGLVRSQQAAVEMLPARAGPVEIRTSEGFIRAEGQVPTPTAAGSFGVYRAGGAARAAPPPAGTAYAGSGPQGARPGPAGEPQAGADPCRHERARYYRRLLQAAGIDVQDPVALLEGLAGPGGYAGAVLFSGYGLLAGVDPIRPLAWDFELRSLAKDLAACVNEDASRPR